MCLRKRINSLAFAALTALAAAAAPHGAQAQGLDFLWGGDADWGGGRSTVSFSTQYKPGQVVVSFGDRRLYLITAPGKAISYPVAVPRTQSRWQGTTFVSDKRVNPSWTPTPEMLRENPRLPRWVPGGHPMNPLGVRAHVSGLELLSHPRNGCPLDDRPSRVQGLRAHVERRRARSLSARACRCPRDRDVAALQRIHDRVLVFEIERGLLRL